MEIDKDKSPLTYEQWTRLEKLADAAKDALEKEFGIKRPQIT